MSVTRSNYESLFLDYLEGNLDPALAEEFQIFLKRNPDLADEMKVIDQIKLDPPDIHFDSKGKLKKSETVTAFDLQELSISYSEGDLTTDERIGFEQWISDNPEHADEIKLYARLKLMADPAVVYPHKNKLKKSAKIVPLWLRITSVAAMLLLAILLFIPSKEKLILHQNKVAVLKDKSAIKTTDSENKPISETGKIAENSSSKNVVKGKRLNRVQKKTLSIKTTKPDDQVIQYAQRESRLTPLRSRVFVFVLPPDKELVVMRRNTGIPDNQEEVLSELLKVQLAAIRRSEDRELVSPDNLSLMGLQLFAKITGKRLTARKGSNGNVNAVNYHSKILAFSIPVNR